MFDFGFSEIALIGIVALLFIGPKDMPVAIRTITGLLKKGRKLAGEFQSHVDEMVREADLGEARDQLRQLRSFNVRGQIMRVLDEDGSLRRTLDQNPLTPAGLRLAPPTQSLPVSSPGAPAAAQPGVPLQALPAVEGARTADAEQDAADPAPPILPPLTAARLRRERATPPPPPFVPPRPPRPDWRHAERGRGVA